MGMVYPNPSHITPYTFVIAHLSIGNANQKEEEVASAEYHPKQGFGLRITA
jgi:hypothetical protein